MEVEDVTLVPIVPVPEDRVLPPGVKDIDEDDGDNPQLCSEYAMETYVYLKQLEKRSAVPANYLSGTPTNDKMRAVLIDWLVEVQIQFKLLQETLFLTVDTIDRYTIFVTFINCMNYLTLVLSDLWLWRVAAFPAPSCSWSASPPCS